MHAMIRSTKGISMLTLLILLLASGIVGAVLSYLWTAGYYEIVGFKVPENVITITITNVTFPIENSTYFEVAVLNPSYSKTEANITRIAIVTTTNGVEAIFNIPAGFVEPSIPYSLLQGDSVTFKCNRNWGEFAGQTIHVVVFLQDDSGGTFPYKTDKVELEIVEVDFDTTVTIERFNVTVANSAESTIPLNVTQIQFGSSVIPPENMTIQDENATLPLQLQPGENKTFTCYWNLWKKDLLGSNHTVTAKSLQGYSAVPKTVSLPPAVSLNITNVTFTTLPDTSGFNVTVSSSPSSPHFVNITEVTVTNGTQIFKNVTITNDITQGLMPGDNFTLQCLWDWATFKNRTMEITVHTIQGYYISKYTFGRLPVASFIYSPTTPYTNETVTFTASESHDPDGEIVSYLWDFGDGTNGTGEITTHTYADDGNYTVTLVVIDDNGLTDKISANITVLNTPPVALFTESATTVTIGENITFNATDSYDLDGSIISYFWDFGDGTNATGIIVNHAYASNGTFIVTLTVTDNENATSSVNATKTVLPNGLAAASFVESAENFSTDKSITFSIKNSNNSKDFNEEEKHRCEFLPVMLI